MRVRRYRIDGRLLVQLFSHVGPLTFECVGDMPRDAKLVSVQRAGVTGTKPGERVALETELVVEHPTFDEVAEGAQAPVMHLSVRTTLPITQRVLKIHRGDRCTCSDQDFCSLMGHRSECPENLGT